MEYNYRYLQRFALKSKKLRRTLRVRRSFFDLI
jgi:hypothetical protein